MNKKILIATIFAVGSVFLFLSIMALGNKQIQIGEEFYGFSANGIDHYSFCISQSSPRVILNDNDSKMEYSSTSDKAQFPKKFIMKSKILILCNNIPNENDISTRATLSRTILYKIDFTFKQKIKMCEKFVKNDKTLSAKEKILVVYLLNKNITEATKDFNFRTLRKIIGFVQYDKNKAEKLLIATTETDELKEAYLISIKKSNEVKTQILYFIELTGRSRRTFFRVKGKCRSATKKVCKGGVVSNE